MKPVVIVGGGLSGLAAGVTLSTGNTPLLLFEQKPFLGGRAYSFRDRETGEVIDNGQHLLIVGNTRTLELLRTIGTVDRLFIPRRPELLFHHPVKGFQTLRLPRLAAPFHLLMGALRSPLFSGADLRALLRAGAALRSGVKTEVARMSVRDWLAAQRQPEEIIRSFWEPLALSIMNERPEAASALLFLRSMRTAFFGGWRNAAMAIPTVGLSELFADPAADYIRRHGGDVRSRADVVSLAGDENGVTGVRTRDGALHQCGAVILAVPPARAEALLRDALCGRTQFLHSSAYAHSPIVSLHLWFESDFVPQLMVGLIGRRIQWVCNRRRIVLTGKGGHLSATISAAHAYASLSNEELVRIACDDLGAVYGSAAEHLIRGVVIRERHATVSLTPDIEPLRPGPELPIRNVFLAGDWTATGYPATIEGAVTSGERAAILALRSLARDAARGISGAVAFQNPNRDIIDMKKKTTSGRKMPREKIVLLVDDEPAILNATRAGLLDRGFNVQAVEGAEAAIKAVHDMKPCIIVSDLVMPGTNGFELFQELKKEKEFTSIPFVFLTGVDDYYAKKFGKEIGGAAYVTKPVDLDELEKILRDKIGE